MPLLRRRSILKYSNNVYSCTGNSCSSNCPSNCSSNCPSNCPSNCSSNCPSNCSSNCSSNCVSNCSRDVIFCEIACKRDASCPPVVNSDLVNPCVGSDCSDSICTNCALADTCISDGVCVAESCESSDLCNDFHCNCNVDTCPPVSHINDAL